MKIAPLLTLTLYGLSLYGCRSTSLDVKPACTKPAPLVGHYDPRTPGYGIGLKDPPANFSSTLSRLKNDYSLRIDREWRDLNMFQVIITPPQVARLRCDPAVKWVEHNSVVSIGAAAASPHDL